MGNPVIESRENQLLHIVIIVLASEIVPQPQRNRRQLQPAVSAAEIIHMFITIFFCQIHFLPPLYRRSARGTATTIRLKVPFRPHLCPRPKAFFSIFLYASCLFQHPADMFCGQIPWNGAVCAQQKAFFPAGFDQFPYRLPDLFLIS